MDVNHISPFKDTLIRQRICRQVYSFAGFLQKNWMECLFLSTGSRSSGEYFTDNLYTLDVEIKIEVGTEE